MTIRFLAALAILLMPSVCHARKAQTPDTISARRAFLEMPSIELDMINKNARLDMLDYYDSGSDRRVGNNLYGEAWLEKLTPDYIRVHLSPVSTLQLKVLSLAGGNDIIMAVYTVGDDGGMKDSDVSFYDPHFRPLPSSKYLPDIRLEDFLASKDRKEALKELRDLLQFYGMDFELSPDSDRLTATLSYTETVPVEATDVLASLLKPEIFYCWDGKHFLKQK